MAIRWLVKQPMRPNENSKLEFLTEHHSNWRTFESSILIIRHCVHFGHFKQSILGKYRCSCYLKQWSFRISSSLDASPGDSPIALPNAHLRGELSTTFKWSTLSVLFSFLFGKFKYFLSLPFALYGLEVCGSNVRQFALCARSLGKLVEDRNMLPNGIFSKHYSVNIIHHCIMSVIADRKANNCHFHVKFANTLPMLKWILAWN